MPCRWLLIYREVGLPVFFPLIQEGEAVAWGWNHPVVFLWGGGGVVWYSLEVATWLLEALFSALRGGKPQGQVDRPLLESVVVGERMEAERSGTVFGAFPSLINPECPWLRPRQQGGTVRRRKHKSRSNAFFWRRNYKLQFNHIITLTLSSKLISSLASFHPLGEMNLNE